jgi:superfamily II DNA or RNA helicase/HKD family nuclease
MYSYENLLAATKSGFIKYNPDVARNFQPHLVLNDRATGQKTLEFILENIESCNSFIFSVAFVTRSGVACLHQTLKDFSERGGFGQILISRYLSFSDPHAIKLLQKYKNIEVKFVSAPNFHGKNYLFEFDDYARVLIGSSNLTQDALGKNTEINIAASITRESSLYINVHSYLIEWIKNSEDITDSVWNEYLDAWKNSREQLKKSYENKILGSVVDYIEQKIVPNSMQQDALVNLDKIRKQKLQRSLVISATGTGKTVLSALDVKQSGAQRLLFVVHRLNIAKKAISEFRKVFGNTKSLGLYSAGAELNSTADFIFSTVQTINSDDHLKRFASTDFDYIIIDETHRAGAATYQKVIEYFKPNFLLGMTATPERTDSFDIFSLFNHCIGYEIRLQKALEEDLLTPFHYFGIADITVNDEPVSDLSDFNNLTSKQRINHILEALREYGCDGEVPRGLVFCSRVDEAKELAKAFCLNGYKAKSLTGEDSEYDRELAIQSLESNNSDKLDYLFTVDIFNEGVDIPKVNQVVMLRPTTSAIIFVQQLGRGLRKSEGKEYLTVIDFIGNYQNNYLIPIALYGDSSFSKDKIRRLLNAGSSLIPGASTISFERVAKELIFKSIDKSNLNTKKLLEDDYRLLKFRIGRVPMMMDFIVNNSRDPYQYVHYLNWGSLLKCSMSLDKTIQVPTDKLDLLEYLGKHVCDGKRIEESIILKILLKQDITTYAEIISEIDNLAGYQTVIQVIDSAIHNLNLHYVTERLNSKTLRVSEVTGFKLIKLEGLKIVKDKSLSEVCNIEFLKNYFLDLAEASIQTFLSNLNVSNFIGGFKRGEKYTRKDVFRILGYDKRPNEQNVGGYLSNGVSCPIFTTYKKSDNISATTKYEDKFVNPDHLIYMSKSNRTLMSSDVQAMFNQKINGLRMPFFVKKSDDEGLDFYYLGELSSISENFEDSTMPDENGLQKSVVKMEFLLDKPVDSKLYKYLTEPSI